MTEPEVIGAAVAPESDGLVAGLRAGRPEAVEELCLRFGPRLHRYAMAWLIGDGSGAEEVVGDALLDAARNIARFDPRRARLGPWLYGIVRRKVQDELRRRHRRGVVPASRQVSVEALDEVPTSADMAEALSARVAAQRQVAALAEALTPIEFEVLVLHCVGEFTAPEVGRIVGRSARAVHSILHRARGKARERLAHDE